MRIFTVENYKSIKSTGAVKTNKLVYAVKDANADEMRQHRFVYDDVNNFWWTSQDFKVAPFWECAETTELKEELRGLILSYVASTAQDSAIPLLAPKGLAYMPYQRAGIAYGLTKESLLIADAPGLGKAQPLNAKVLTPEGWVEIGSVQVGDKVIGSNGKTVNVTGVFPQGEKDIYRVTFQDGASTECCDEHLWSIETKTDRARKVNKNRVLPLSEFKDNLRQSHGSRNYYIPMVEPIHFENKELPLDPYVLGVLLGDGGIAHRIILSSEDQEIINSVSNLLPNSVKIVFSDRCSYRIVKKDENNQFGPNEVMNSLRDLNLFGKKSDKKFIPDIYKFSDIESRISVLQGLLDTDGTVVKGRNGSAGTIQFCSCSDQLANDLIFIVQSLGGTAKKKFKLNGFLGAWIITIRLPNGIEPFRLTRKKDLAGQKIKYFPYRVFDKVELVGRKEAVCISVDAADHLYITDDCIVTHNTIQSIGIVNNDPNCRRLIVVCPASLKINWKREIEKWSVIPTATYIASGRKSKDDEMFNFFKSFQGNCLKTVVINYDILSGWMPLLSQVKGATLVFDEAHLLKNSKTSRSKAAFSLEGNRRIFLSGTPILSRPMEIFPLLHSIDKKTFPDYFTFGLRYCNGHEGYSGWDFKGSSNLDELNILLRCKIMVRRLKEDVLKDLPDKIRHVVVLQNPEKNNVDVNRILEDAGVKIDEEGNIQSNSFATEGIALLAQQRHHDALRKVPQVIDYINNLIEGGVNKVILFSYHTDVMDAYEKAFKDISVRISGNVSMNKRQKAVDDFQQNPDVILMNAQIDAAGVGYTLTAASNVIFAELDWVPAKITQCEDRAHRHGQKDTVFVHHLVMENSVDETIATALIKKQVVLDKALDDKVNPAFLPTLGDDQVPINF